MTERDSGTPVYGIAIAAQLVGMPIPTLRLFESKGLLTPSRSDGGTRQYSDDDIDRLKRAGRLRDEGLNIAGISRVLDLEDANAQLQAELSESRGADGGGERPAS
ncbi:MerR family transcriptional regulator [Microbacterium resistens]|uniref:MerR family transcriptional regulator n=1 Tax=Microbacterium resistens TaxID=156977 RepID=UPI00083320EE|nr:MerR family transcriptional regulator [Microbacterium resistens]